MEVHNVDVAASKHTNHVQHKPRVLRELCDATAIFFCLFLMKILMRQKTAFNHHGATRSKTYEWNRLDHLFFRKHIFLVKKMQFAYAQLLPACDGFNCK